MSLLLSSCRNLGDQTHLFLFSLIQGLAHGNLRVKSGLCLFHGGLWANNGVYGFIFKGLLTTNQNTHKINRRICGRDQMWLVKLKIFTIWPLIEKFAAPWPCQHNLFTVQAGTCLLSVSGLQSKPTGGSTGNSLSYIYPSNRLLFWEEGAVPPITFS